MKPRVLIADDHRLVAEGLSRLLGSDYELVGIVENGRELVKAADRHHPDLIVADISMPELNGIEAVRQIKKNDQHVKVVFLTMHPDVCYAVEAFSVGASGYLLKHSATSELLSALQEVSQGKTYMTPLIAAELIESYKNGGHVRNDALAMLSGRQREVLQLLVEGKSAKIVAEELYISPRTVEFHKYDMMKKLGINSSAELVQFAITHGIISPV